jgi:hypothetical protein
MNSARTDFPQRRGDRKAAVFERGLISWLRLQNLLPISGIGGCPTNPEKEVANGYAQHGWLLVWRYPL